MEEEKDRFNTSRVDFLDWLKSAWLPHINREK
jgi:hypothetical protein